MIKRKSPVVLVSLLVILVGGLVVWNAGQAKSAAAHDEHALEQEQPESPEEPKMVGDKRAETSKGDMAASLKSNAAHRDVDDGDSATPRTNRLIATKPLILRPKYAKYDPKPSETNTSTQWYRDDSGVGTKAAQDREKAGK